MVLTYRTPMPPNKSKRPPPPPRLDEPSYEKIKKRNTDMLEDVRDARQIVYEYGSRIPSLCEAIILLDSAISIGEKQ